MLHRARLLRLSSGLVVAPVDGALVVGTVSQGVQQEERNSKPAPAPPGGSHEAGTAFTNDKYRRFRYLLASIVGRRVPVILPSRYHRRSDSYTSKNKVDYHISIKPDGDYGSYHTLVIRNNNYRHLGNLKTAVNDATSVASLLKNDYGFKVRLLENATRSDVIRSLSGLRKSVGRDDNLLVYYAGHGYLDEDINKGYWLPVDADRDHSSNWIQNDTIVAQVKGMQAKPSQACHGACSVTAASP